MANLVERLRANIAAAQAIIAASEAGLADLGFVKRSTTSSQGAKRGRPPKTAEPTGLDMIDVRKLKLKDFARTILRERYPDGASWPQICALRGYKPDAPSASFDKGLVRTGIVVLENGLYRIAA